MNFLEAVDPKERAWFLRGTDCWFVEQGRVDVFLTELTEAGEPGLRRGLFRVETGQIFTGLHHTEAQHQFEVIAQLTPDTVVKKVVLERWFDLCFIGKDESWAPLYRDWIINLTDVLTLRPRPKETLVIAQEGSYDLNENLRVFASSKTLFWSLSSNEAIRWIESQHINPGQPILIGEHVWITIDKTAQLTFENFFEGNEEVFGQRITQVLGLFWKSLIDREFKLRVKETQHQVHKTSTGRKIFSNSLKRLAGIISPSASLASLSNTSDQRGELEGTLRVLLETQGIQLQKDPVPVRGGESVIDQLEALGREYSVNYRRVMLKGDEWWKDDVGPFLAFWHENGRPVAILPQKWGKPPIILDAVTSETTPVDSVSSSQLDETAYVFYGTLPPRAVLFKELFKFGLNQTFTDSVVVGVCAISVALLGLLTPMITGELISSVIPDAAYDRLFQFSCILLLATLTSSIFGFAQALCLQRLQARIGSNINSAIMDRLLNMPPSFFKNYSAGDLAARTFGMDSILQLTTGSVLKTILSGIFSIFSLIYLYTINTTLANVAAVIGVVTLSITVGINFWMVRFERALADTQGELDGEVFQLLTGLTKIRVAAVEDRAFGRWVNGFSKMNSLTFNAGSRANVIEIFNAALPGIASICLFITMAFYLSDQMDASSFISFNSAFGQFLSGSTAMGLAMVSINKVIPLYERMKPIVEGAPEFDDTKSMAPTLLGDIEVANVTFTYPGATRPILEDFSLRVKPGEFLAIVGASGCGKSTLFRLFLGFERPESGSIYFDHMDLADLDIKSVRKQIGVVLQNGRLMPGSVFSNIVGSLDLTSEQAMDAAKMAGMDEDIAAMPMGLHTLISEGGGGLSGGQRQRLLIARALANKPRILLFDEATSALDNLTQTIVSRSIEQLNSTRIVIAHRLSTIKNADRIIVLDKGRIVEEGDYSALMELGGVFAELAKRQLV